MEAIKSATLLIIVMIAITGGSVVRGQAPTNSKDRRFLRAYDGPNQTGASYLFLENSPDLSVQGMDNIIESSHATGLWILYGQTDFSYGPTCHTAGVDTYSNWTSYCANLVSSIRYAGSPYGLNDDYYNLYDNEYLEAEELGGNTDKATLGSFDLRTSSLALSGQSEWTLYTGQNYTGTSVCVVPTEELSGSDGTVMNYVYIRTMAEIGLPDNSVRSIARGCLSERVVRAPRLNNSDILSPVLPSP
jgi:hypothetical protein